MKEKEKSKNIIVFVKCVSIKIGLEVLSGFPLKLCMFLQNYEK